MRPQQLRAAGRERARRGAAATRGWGRHGQLPRPPRRFPRGHPDPRTAVCAAGPTNRTRVPGAEALAGRARAWRKDRRKPRLRPQGGRRQKATSTVPSSRTRMACGPREGQAGVRRAGSRRGRVLTSTEGGQTAPQRPRAEGTRAGGVAGADGRPGWTAAWKGHPPPSARPEARASPPPPRDRRPSAPRRATPTSTGATQLNAVFSFLM